MTKIQILAYYLPQYHPIPENDEWWGKGFTEWTNVTKAKPLFKGHYQPILPGELGFYDLRIPSVQVRQAELAMENGIDGFIYYQYWFGNGKMLLEKPAEAMLANKDIKIPFCFCWANQTWKGIWHGLDNPKILIEQTYHGKNDYINYFNYLLPFFKDSRYIKIDNKPMFHIYRLEEIPDIKFFLELFNEYAKNHGFDGIYFVATGNEKSIDIIKNDDIRGVIGLDTFNKIRNQQRTFFNRKTVLGRIENKLLSKMGYSNEVSYRKKPIILDYAKGVSHLNINFLNKKYIPCVFPNWDNSARSGKKSLIFKNATPVAWYEHLLKSIHQLQLNKENPQFLIIKSWNEWAEGNYLEPDLKYGLAWLEMVRKAKDYSNDYF